MKLVQFSCYTLQYLTIQVWKVHCSHS